MTLPYHLLQNGWKSKVACDSETLQLFLSGSLHLKGTILLIPFMVSGVFIPEVLEMK